MNEFLLASFIFFFQLCSRDLAGNPYQRQLTQGFPPLQERLSVLAAPRMVRSTFHFARLRSAGGVYLSGGLKPATETSRILTFPPLIEAEVFPTEINKKAACLRETRCLFCFLHQRNRDRITVSRLSQYPGSNDTHRLSAHRRLPRRRQ